MGARDLFFGFFGISLISTSCKQEKAIAVSEGEVVVSSAHIPKTIDFQHVPRDGEVQGLLTTIEGSSLKTHLEFRFENDIYDVHFFESSPTVGGAESWSRSFELAKNGEKLLTPAVFSNGDDEFIGCSFDDKQIYMLIDFEGLSIRGVAFDQSTESNSFLHFSTKPDDFNGDYGKIISVVSKIWQMLKCEMPN